MPSIYPNTPIILASGSHSRRVMLEDAGIHFEVISSHVDEDLLKKEMDGLPFEDQVISLAAAKASEVSINNPNHLVIGGDQMCIFQNKVFDKPGSKDKAIENLKLLSSAYFYSRDIAKGIDILKMLALGADAVMIGRPICIAAFGAAQEGVEFYLDQKRSELKKAMTGNLIGKISSLLNIINLIFNEICIFDGYGLCHGPFRC